MSSKRNPKVGTRTFAGKPNLYERLRKNGETVFYHRRRIAGEPDQYLRLAATTISDALVEQGQRFAPGTVIPVARRNMKFDDALWAEFLAAKYTNASTRRAYDKTWRLHLRETLLGKKVEKVRANVPQQITQRMEQDGLSPSTVARAQMALSAFYTWANENGIATHNPVRELPSTMKRGFRAGRKVTAADVLTPQQVERIAAAALMRSERGRVYATAFQLAPLLGCRISELLALKWSNVQGRMLLIEWQLGERYTAGDPTTWLVRLKGETEMAQGKARKIVLSQAAVALLTEYRTWALSQGLYRADGFIFPSSKHTPLKQETLSSTLRDAVEAAGIGQRVIFHHFRHTCASRMFAWGLTAADVARHLGDTEAVVRKTYIHFIHDEAVVARYDEMEAAHARLAS